MSKRLHTLKNRLGLRESLLQDYRTGILSAGDALPPVRELAALHGLSPATAQRVLRGLADEGVLHLRQGAGAFISHLPEHTDCTFSVVFSDELYGMQDFIAAREGFEAEIAQRAGASLTLTPKTRGLAKLMDGICSGDIKIGGAFFVPSTDPAKLLAGQKVLSMLRGIPLVVQVNAPGEGHTDAAGIAHDTIRFDDEGGAQQAVRHLWRRGHRKLAFLGIHGDDGAATKFPWSAQRAAGFTAATEALKTEAQVFHPAQDPPRLQMADQEWAARMAAEPLIPLLREGKVKAVVCANAFALMGLLKAAHSAGLPESCWPAIVAFDDRAEDDHLLSVLRLPWGDMGRAAAVALWERVFGTQAQREAPPREIAVPMRMVARLSCSTSYENMSVVDAAFASARAL